MLLVENFVDEELLNDLEYQAALDQALKEADAPIVDLKKRSHHNILARPSGYWNNTGVFKPKGVSLLVVYTGDTWHSNPYWGPTDGAGDSRYIANGSYLRPGAPEGCLVGKVGGSSTAGGSETFALGNHGYVTPELEGLLWLSVNDAPAGFGDNSGYISVSIRHIR